MKVSLIILSVLIFLFGSISASAQTGSGGSNSVKLLLGTSSALGLPSDNSVIIPQAGLDFCFGKIGIRTTGQIFKTSPEFDISGYLDPITSYITQTGLKEQNSNLLLGISPYMNIGKGFFSLQPSLGLKYLMQNGATASAVYKQSSSMSFLKFPTEDAKRSMFMIEPNIRLVFGKEGKAVHFFAEASYAMALSANEFSYTSRDLTGVIRTDGSIDADMLEMSKTVTKTEKAFPNCPIIGVGVELELTKGKQKLPIQNKIKTQRERNIENDKSDDCCNQITVYSESSNNSDCCYKIFYTIPKDCMARGAEIKTLNGTQFTVLQDIFGFNQLSDVSSHSIYPGGNTYLPYGANPNLLAEICGSSNNTNDMEVEILFHLLSSDRQCSYTLKLPCPTANDCCKEKIIDVIEGPNQIINTPLAYDELHFSSTLSFGPDAVNRVVAEIVSFSYKVNDKLCEVCNADKNAHGDFLDESLNKITNNPSYWINQGKSTFVGALGKSRQAEWNSLVNPVNISSGIGINHVIGIPEMNELNCCYGIINLTIRYSVFYNTPGDLPECRVCEVLKHYCIERRGTICPDPINCKDY